jgi:hypothetical protein
MMHKTKMGASKMGTVKTGGDRRDGIASKGLTQAMAGWLVAVKPK